MHASHIGLLLLSVIVSGCAPDLEDPSRFEGDDLCDLDVQRDLLVPRCARSGCHVPEEPASGIDYLSGGLAARLVGRESITCDGRLVIDPAHPEESYLLERLSEEPRCGDSPVAPMPLDGREPLSEHERDCVARWVRSLAAPAAPDGGAP